MDTYSYTINEIQMDEFDAEVQKFQEQEARRKVRKDKRELKRTAREAKQESFNRFPRFVF